MRGCILNLHRVFWAWHSFLLQSVLFRRSLFSSGFSTCAHSSSISNCLGLCHIAFLSCVVLLSSFCNVQFLFFVSFLYKYLLIWTHTHKRCYILYSIFQIKIHVGISLINFNFPRLGFFNRTVYVRIFVIVYVCVCTNIL